MALQASVQRRSVLTLQYLRHPTFLRPSLANVSMCSPCLQKGAMLKLLLLQVGWQPEGIAGSSFILKEWQGQACRNLGV